MSQPNTAPQAKGMDAMQTYQADWWNDSCDLAELAHAVKQGAVGATSNPVIVCAAVKNAPDYWTPVIQELVSRHPSETEDEISWRLIEEVGRQAAAILHPVYERTRAAKGYLCLQVNPKLHNNAQRMVEHARKLRQVADNIAIKIPCTEAGLSAIETLTASGIAVNVTVSFTVAQAVAAAEAIERGLDRARADGVDTGKLRPYVTLMEGRVDDYMQRATEGQEGVSSETLRWSGVAVFKKLARLFRQRGFAGTLLAAAYRHELHWSEIVGPGVIQSIPYGWWTKFHESGIALRHALDEEVPEKELEALLAMDAFHVAYDDDALQPADYTRFDGSRHTLNQFINGYHDLLQIVRDVMLR